MSDAAVSMRGLVKVYPGGAKALAGLDLEVRRGAIHALVGPNGVGKTTALRIAAGLIRPTEGCAEVFGEDPFACAPALRRRIGVLADRPVVYPWFTVNDAIEFVAGLHGDGFDRAGAERLRGRLDLPRDAKVSSLSLGMGRRLEILLAVAPRPDLLILDEPAGGLDPLARREMLDIVLDLVREREATVLYSTHVLSDVERVAGEVGFLRDGRLLFSRSLDALKEGFRKVRIAFDGAMPAAERLRSEPGVWDVRVEGREALVTVDLPDDGQVAALAGRLGGRAAGTFGLDLDEIFVTFFKRAGKGAA